MEGQERNSPGPRPVEANQIQSGWKDSLEHVIVPSHSTTSSLCPVSSLFTKSPCIIGSVCLTR